MAKNTSITADDTLPARRNRTGEVTRAAVQVFYRNGYAAASVQDIADVVGVFKGSLYHYISTKEDLLARIVEDVHVHSTAMLDEIRALDVPAIERLQLYIERHVKWHLDNVEEVTVALRDWRYLTGERLATAEKHRRAYERAMRQLIATARNEGAIDPAVNPRHAAFFILSAINHVPEWYRRGGSDSASRIAASYADMTMGTLMGTRPRARTKPARSPRRAA